MHLSSGVRDCSPRLIFGRQTALTLRQVAVHQAISILFEIGIAQTKRVTHLVHDRGEQIDATGRCARRIGVAAREGSFVREERIALPACVNEPAVAARVVAYADVSAACFAQMKIGQGGHVKVEVAQDGDLLSRQAGCLPPRDCGGNCAIQFGLAEKVVIRSWNDWRGGLQ